MNLSKRKITAGEEQLLRSVFTDTLPYASLEVAPNTDDMGGVDNSITPGDTPFLSTTLWCADFSDPSVNDSDKAVFIHEFVHVWQFFHGITKLSAIWLAVRLLGDYRLAYPYDLLDESDLTDFNIEQQASIIEDWWLITKGHLPLNNTGSTRRVSDYQPYVDQLRGAGIPYKPMIPTPRYRH